MSEDESNKSKNTKCKHDWKAVEETHMKTHVKIVCLKCGAEKEIAQFPF